MNSIKTKTNKYMLINNKAIAAVSFTPIDNYITVIVVWEWEGQAQDSFFAIITAAIENTDFKFRDAIDYVADFGVEVTHLKEYRMLFPHIFKN